LLLNKKRLRKVTDSERNASAALRRTASRPRRSREAGQPTSRRGGGTSELKVIEEPSPEDDDSRFSLGWGCALSLIAIRKQCSSFERARHIGKKPEEGRKRSATVLCSREGREGNAERSATYYK
jgi:hypothetical protein